MPHNGWSETMLPGDGWITEHSPSDKLTYIQPYGNGWQYPVHGHMVRVSTQDMRPTDVTTPWLIAPHDNVDLGLSPVLSHESQNSHSLTSFSEPDMSFAPASSDCSFVTAPVWNSNGHTTYQGRQPSQHGPIPGGYFVPAQTARLCDPVFDVGYRTAAPQPAATYYHPPGYTPRTPDTVNSGHAISYPAVQLRPLRSRSDPTGVPNQPVYGPQRILRPHVPGMRVLHPTMSVSTIHGDTNGAPSLVRSPPRTAVEASQSRSMLSTQTDARQPTWAPSSHVGTHHAMDVSRQDPIVRLRPTGPTGYWPDQTEDWSSFIHFDQDERHATSMSSSFSAGYAPVFVRADTQSGSSGHVKPLAAKPKQEACAIVPAVSHPDISAAASTESEEGRHRNHPLYSEGPHADGMFHCPFATDPTCQHGPTKLKCNYDKFIDSHLKPFRCKLDACSKQEFSSTACLLRHEREAHGMHGHGDRPHLCYYEGCERGVSGNGFPRRYNLFDHMKRVHDHKEEPESATGSPDLGSTSQSQRRIIGRKRKASGPIAGEPVLQRKRSEYTPVQISQPIPAAVQTAQSMVLPQAGYPLPQASNGPFTPPEYYPPPALQPQRVQPDHRQRQLYPQWTDQQDITTRQMDAVQNPEHEVSNHWLSEHIAELRRPSEEARRG
ncbi:hypothetical protein LTS09_010490 [Friedmanniomyces endolithicus]|nr:hypothetical protein LTS09_010490 [Friedmanniomyces endolithicus]